MRVDDMAGYVCQALIGGPAALRGGRATDVGTDRFGE